MERIRDAIESVIRGLTVKKTAGRGVNPQEWLKKALTKKELGHIKFHYFRKGIFGVRVDSSVWMYNLSLKKESLLSKLREQTPNIKEVHFSIGDIK
ncbi:MAG: hypothetical protein COT38_05400 [Candidatus Omnitrophica bacterium CG08_land_8_20_14_0_20_41_16]|nr:MAG: hypothetical protein COT38_05400 [Candidatus Omnitrophica bacterium CG08_land_8_20_14_0_20_41_16]